MSVPITYQDCVRLIDTAVGCYGNELYASEATVAAMFVQSSGWRRQASQELLSGDATALVDPDDDFVTSRAYHLEDVLLVASPFGSDDWYRVIRVSVGRDTLLANEVNVVRLTLKRTTAPAGIS